MRKDGIREKKRRVSRRRRVNRHRMSMLAVSSVILLLVIVLSVNGVSLVAREKQYRAQEAELAEQIEEEKDRSAEIDKLEKYVGTNAWVEEVAKDKLGLINENEIIFKAK